MSNGDTINEIKSLLSEKGAIKTQIALRLLLDISAKTYLEQERRIAALETKLDKVEKSSIVLWVQKNPSAAVFIVTVYIIVSSVISWEDVIARALKIAP